MMALPYSKQWAIHGQAVNVHTYWPQTCMYPTTQATFSNTNDTCEVEKEAILGLQGTLHVPQPGKVRAASQWT